jgi:thioredoxin 1
MIGLVRERCKHRPILGNTLAASDVENRSDDERITKGTELATAVKTDTFEQEVLQSETPVLVDFWAEWCGPCHAVSPVLDRIAEERAGELRLVKVNVDEEQELMIRYGVQSIPTIVLFRDGEPAAAVVGAMPKGAIERGLGLTENGSGA